VAAPTQRCWPRDALESTDVAFVWEHAAASGKGPVVRGWAPRVGVVRDALNVYLRVGGHRDRCARADLADDGGSVRQRKVAR
jgi:hypothetical protein